MTDLAAIVRQLEQMFEQKLTQRPIVTRFAPSPTGFLHLGHVAHAVYVWSLARELEAEVLLRIEDHDLQRCRKEYTAAILADLDKLGFVPDGGFSSEGSLSAAGHSFLQSENKAYYIQRLEELKANGHVYPCACSRKDLTIRNSSSRRVGLNTAYDGYCLKHPPLDGQKVCWRLKVPAESTLSFWDARLGLIQQQPAMQCGDFPLMDVYGNLTYHMAVVVDDLRHGVNLIIRGEDLLDSTGRQLYLRQLLAPKAEAPVYVHHPLLSEAGETEKLSKSKHSESVASLLNRGFSAEELIGEAARRLGLV